MPKRRPPPPQTEVEKSLMAALERLRASSPTDPTLVKKARLGQLRINPSTVAREAGHARTLIGHENCAYPRVRAAIKVLKVSRAGPATSFEEINRNLRVENRQLRQSVTLAMSRVAAAIRRMDAVEKAALRKAAEAERRSGRPRSGIDMNEIAGSKLLNAESTVVDIDTARSK